MVRQNVTGNKSRIKCSGAEITIKLLERQGIQTIAGMPGGCNLPIYNALCKSNIRHILIRHEQAAGFIAQGMARTTGKAAVCFATSGPGVTNLLTAIADAKLDSIPMVAITGQVPNALIGTDAFQEVDTYGMTLPITKHNYLIHSAEELFKVIPEAFKIAESGRPGPVLIDIPKDVQLEEIEFEEWPLPQGKEEIQYSIDEFKIEQTANMIHAAKKPILYIGGGIVHADAHEILRNFARKNNIPVASTLMGLGCFPAEDPLYLGMLGMHASRYTNYLLDEADLILALGVRFDDRATGNVEKFCPNAKVIHIDVDASEINKLKRADVSIVGDVGRVLEQLLPLLKEDSRKEWIAYVERMKEEFPFNMPKDTSILHPINFIRTVGRLAGKHTIVATDVGQHQMWVAQVYPFYEPRTLLTSGGLGTMGFGLPAAMGAALSNPQKRVVCFSGDGSILMNIQELATLADLNVNVTVFILNNGHLGLVRQQQEMFYNQNYIASKFEGGTDFAAIARGFGIRSYDLGKEEDPMKILIESLDEPGPCLINIPIHAVENVLPIVPPGAGNCEMMGEEA